MLEFLFLSKFDCLEQYSLDTFLLQHYPCLETRFHALFQHEKEVITDIYMCIYISTYIYVYICIYI